MLSSRTMKSAFLAVLAAAALSTTALAAAPAPTATATETNWVGTFTYYDQVPGADDGTTSFLLTVTRNKSGYTLVFDDQGMANTSYRATGTVNAKGELEAKFQKDL